MMTRFGPRALGLALALVAAPAFAQPVGLPRTETATELEPVVVSPQRRSGSRFEAGASVGRVTAEKARAMGARTPPEALEETTAVTVQVTNRGAGAPILRGLIGPSNMMMLDGLRFHQSTWRTGPNQYLAAIDMSSIDTIEVLHGSQSVAYGSSAMGGVISVQPHALPVEVGKAAGAGVRYSTADGGVEVWGQASLRRGALSALAAGGYRRFGELRLGGGDTAPISAYSQGGWLARVGYDLGPKTEIRVSALGNRLLDAGRADSLNAGDLRWYDNADDMIWLDFGHGGGESSKSGIVEKVRASVALHRSNEVARRVRCKIGDVSTDVPSCVAGAEALQADQDTSPLAVVTREQRTEDTVNSLGGLVRAALRPMAGAWRSRLRIDVGAELWRDGIDTSTSAERRSDKGWTYVDAARGNFSADSAFTEFGAFVLADAVALRTDTLRLLVDAGLRHAVFSAHAAAVPKLGDIAYDASGLVGSAGLRLLLGDVMAYASWHQGLRAPNLQETTVLGDTGSTFEVPNRDLRAERSDALELGARLRWTKVTLHAALWQIALQDVIDQREVNASEYADFGIDSATVGTKPVRQRVNRERGTLQGGQLEVRGHLAHGLQPWLRIAATTGDIEAEDGTTSPFRRIPPLGGAFGVQVGRGRWTGEVFGRFAASQDRLAAGDESDLRICEDPGNLGKTYKDGGKACPGTPGYLDVGLRGGVALGHDLRLDAVVRNLLDARYRVHGSGLDAPGVGVSVALSGRL